MKDGEVEKVKRIPAVKIVHDLIKKSDQGIDTSGLMKATGYDRIKIQSILFRLKKQGRIECVRRGIYK
jgi:predicted transcriptional regulator of viral defense system